MSNERARLHNLFPDLDFDPQALREKYRQERDKRVRDDGEDQYIEAAAQFARCTNPTEAFAVQTEFVNKMAADYFAESQKMIELMGEMAKQVSSSPKSNTARH